MPVKDRGMPKVRYALYPGGVISPNDGQSHYVGALALARLYGVPMNECIVCDPRAPWSPAHLYHEGLIKLRPKSNGDYRLPVPGAQSIAQTS